MNERTEKDAASKKKREESNLDPYEINFLPQFETGRGPREAFVNEYGVVIGDHEYDSPNSPLNCWSKNTDPEIMSGDQWVHPFKDIGFQTEENRDYFEKGIEPQGGMFMHPDKDVAYEASLENWDGEARADLEHKRTENKGEKQDEQRTEVDG